MKRIATLSLVVILLAFAVFATACQSTDGIEVVALPENCVFYVGELIDVTGGQIKVVVGEEEQTVDMTPDMITYITDADGITNILFADAPFKSAGKKIVNLKYSDMYAKFEVYVDSNTDNYKAHCYSKLDELAKDERLDDAALTAIADAKVKISAVTTFEEANKIFEQAYGFVAEYYSIKSIEKERDAQASLVEKALTDFDLSGFSMDQSKLITEKIVTLRTDIDVTKTKEGIDTLYAEFEKSIEDMRTDKANEFVANLEKRFADEYESKKDYYTEQKYEELIALFIDYEALIREKETESEMQATEKLLFDTELTAVDDIVDMIYDDCAPLIEDGVVFTKHKATIDSINSQILSFIEKIDSLEIHDVNKDDRVDVRDILSSENYQALKASQSFIKYEKGNIIEALDALMDEYATLKKANEEAPTVVSSITAIGKLNLGSEDKIKKARQAFDTWSNKYSIDEDNANIELISNYKILVTAEGTFEDMPENAKRDAKYIRELIEDIEDNGVIYSNGRKGIASDLTEAEEEYDAWSDTYGAAYVDEYINTTSYDYVEALEEIRDEYDKLVKEAERILNEITILYRFADQLVLDETYTTSIDSIRKSKEQIVGLGEAFAESNGGESDVISDELEEMDLEISKRVFAANKKSNIEAVKNESYKYVAMLSSTSKKDKIKAIASDGEKALNAMTYNTKLTEHENILLLGDKRQEYIVKLAKKYEEIK